MTSPPRGSWAASLTVRRLLPRRLPAPPLWPPGLGASCDGSRRAWSAARGASGVGSGGAAYAKPKAPPAALAAAAAAGALGGGAIALAACFWLLRKDGGSGEVDRQASANGIASAERFPPPAQPAEAEASEVQPVVSSRAYRRVLYVMRGLPGSGKSTMARETLREHLTAIEVPSSGGIERIAPLYRGFILSTDDFFSPIHEETGIEHYVFDIKRIGSNHQRNQTRCAVAMELGVTPIIVDNTNTMFWEMKPYLELAKQHGYAIVVKDVQRIFKDSISLEVLKQRCLARDAQGKDIPDVALERMWKRYEQLPEDPAEAEALILKAEMPPRNAPA